MKDFIQKEHKLFIRFSDFLSNNSVVEIKKLHRDIKNFFDKSQKKDGILSYVSLILEIFSVETKNEDLEDIFDYDSKMSKTYKIADNIIEKLRELSEKEITFQYLVIFQVILPYVRDLEESEQLCQKALKVLKILVEDESAYINSKFNFHMNMIARILKAEFFEVDHEKNKILAKRVKEIYNYHLKEALELCENTNEIMKEKEEWLRLRVGLMERDSEEVTKYLEYISSSTLSKIFNDRVREEVSYCSFDVAFKLTQKHFNAALGIRIRKLRERTGISVDGFSYKLGYEDRQMIRNIEKGETNMSVFKLAHIADLFGVTAEELFYGKKGRKVTPLTKEDFEYVI